MISKQLNGIEANLRDLEKLHQDSYRKHGHLNHPEFFEKRRAILQRLDFSLGKLARKGLSLDDSSKLKRALGLSSKSIVNDWKQAGVGDIPGYSTHYERVANGARYMSRVGYLAIGLDASLATSEILEACQSGNDQECRAVTYSETGRLTGSVFGGAAGSLMGSTACIAIGFATASVGGIACAVILGGVGSATGGAKGGDLGAGMGDLLREVIHGQ